MVCPLPQNYSSPMDYQYYLVVTLKWYETTQGVPLPPLPPPKKKKNKIKGNFEPPPNTHKKQQQKTRTQRKNGEKKKKKRELSLRILPWRTRLLTSLYEKRLVRRGLQQQYLMRFSNLVTFIYARNIK